MEIFSFWVLKFMLFSILGYIMEVIFAYFKDHKFINRGFLYGPYCSIYGCAGILMAFIDPKLNIFLIFLLSAFLCGLLEGITGFLLDYFLHMRFWNYKDNFLNINGYTCPKFMMIFGIFSIIGVYYLNPFYDYLYSLCNNVLLNVITINFVICYSIDGIVSIIMLFRLKNKLNKKQLDDTTTIIENKKEGLREALRIAD